MKRQLLSDQEKRSEEQKQTKINANEDNSNDKLIIDKQDLKSKIWNLGFADFVIKNCKKDCKKRRFSYKTNILHRFKCLL